MGEMYQFNKKIAYMSVPDRSIFLLTQAGIKLSQCDGLIFGRGPGSFTGVRIGVGVAQGLAFSANLPVFGVSSLQAMAQLAFIKGKIQGKVKGKSTGVIAAIDARMGEVYNGYFVLDENNIMQSQCEEAVTAPEQLAQHLSSVVNKPEYGVGSAWDAYNEKLSSLKSNTGSPDVLFPSAEAMLAIGVISLEQGKGVAAEDAQPIYVRDTVSWKKLPGRE